MDNWTAFNVLQILTKGKYYTKGYTLEGKTNYEFIQEICFRADYTKILYCVYGNHSDKTVQITRDHVPIKDINSYLLKMIGYISQIDYKLLYSPAYIGCLLDVIDKYYFIKNDKLYELSIDRKLRINVLMVDCSGETENTDSRCNPTLLRVDDAFVSDNPTLLRVDDAFVRDNPTLLRVDDAFVSDNPDYNSFKELSECFMHLTFMDEHRCEFEDFARVIHS